MAKKEGSAADMLTENENENVTHGFKHKTSLAYIEPYCRKNAIYHNSIITLLRHLLFKYDAHLIIELTSLQ
jgi:hypothetical protein